MKIKITDSEKETSYIANNINEVKACDVHGAQLLIYLNKKDGERVVSCGKTFFEII